MIQAIVLGAIQGLGEFLPISSSAHLIIFPRLFGWEDQGLSFDVALHLGTLFAVIIFFHTEWVSLIKAFFSSLKERKIVSPEQKLAWFVVVASIPGAIGGFLLEHHVESTFRSPLLIAITLSVFGVILYLTDIYGKKKKDLNKMTFLDSAIIGFTQLLAIIPGVSRSGATIAGGLSLGLSRVDAVKFSFLLSAPIILGAGIAELPNISENFNMSVLAGFFSSLIVGMISISLLLKYIKKNNFLIFTFYRIVLALVIISLIK